MWTMAPQQVFCLLVLVVTFTCCNSSPIIPAGFSLMSAGMEWCGDNFCQHGGICIKQNKMEKCMCMPGYIGRYCHIQKNLAPTFKTENYKSHTVAAIGSSLNFSCEAIARPKPMVDWFKNDEPLFPSDVDAIKEWQIEFKTLKPANAGNYSCVIVNRFGIAVRTFSLEIVAKKNSAPVFESEEVETYTTAAIGSSLSFNCQAITGPDYIVDWLKNGKQLLPSEVDAVTEWEISFDALKPAHTGNYTCIVINRFGATDRTYELKVIGKEGRAPIFEREEYNPYKRVVVGSSLDFDCKTDGSPPVVVKWQKNGRQLRSDEVDEIKEWQIMFNAVEPVQSGNYTCTAINKFGSTKRTYILEVIGKNKSTPMFENEKYESHIIAVAGSSYSFNCKAYGRPRFTVDWLKNNRPLNSSEIDDSNYWQLTFNVVKPIHEGNYTCIVANKFGSINRTIAFEVAGILTESCTTIPTIKLHATEISTHVGEDLELMCDVENCSHPSPFVRWIRTFDSNRRPIVHKAIEVKNSTAFYLHLRNMTSDDSGNYTCSVWTSFGESKKSVRVTVLSSLERYNHLRVHEKETDEFQIKWQFPALSVLVTFIVLCTLVLVYRYTVCNCNRQKKALLCKRIVFTKQTLENLDSNSPLVRVEYLNWRYLYSNEHHLEYDIPLDPEWEHPRERLTLGEPLGHGEFGKVVQAVSKDRNDDNRTQTVAVKMLKDNHSEEAMVSLVSEMQVMKLIGRHLNIINLIGCCSQNGPLYVIVEYAANGNLQDYLRSKRMASDAESLDETLPYVITEKQLILFARQIANGMDYLEARGYIHRDLAARNVLVMEDLTLKISDFGFAKDLTESKYYKKTTQGLLPVRWMAIESLTNGVFTIKSDVWSYGILLWEIMTLGSMPYQSLRTEDVCPLVVSGHRLRRPKFCPYSTYDLMCMCWEVLPGNRPSFAYLAQELGKILEVASEQIYLAMYVPLDGEDNLNVSSEKATTSSLVTVSAINSASQQANVGLSSKGTVSLPAKDSAVSSPSKEVNVCSRSNGSLDQSCKETVALTPEETTVASISKKTTGYLSSEEAAICLSSKAAAVDSSCKESVVCLPSKEASVGSSLKETTDGSSLKETTDVPSYKEVAVGLPSKATFVGSSLEETTVVPSYQEVAVDSSLEKTVVDLSLKEDAIGFSCKEAFCFPSTKDSAIPSLKETTVGLSSKESGAVGSPSKEAAVCSPLEESVALLLKEADVGSSLKEDTDCWSSNEAGVGLSSKQDTLSLSFKGKEATIQAAGDSGFGISFLYEPDTWVIKLKE